MKKYLQTHGMFFSVSFIGKIRSSFLPSFQQPRDDQGHGYPRGSRTSRTTTMHTAGLDDPLSLKRGHHDGTHPSGHTQKQPYPYA